MQSTIGSTVHSMLLNSLEHYICKTTMTNIRPDRDSSLVQASVDTNEPSGPARLVVDEDDNGKFRLERAKHIKYRT